MRWTLVEEIVCLDLQYLFNEWVNLAIISLKLMKLIAWIMQIKTESHLNHNDSHCQLKLRLCKLTIVNYIIMIMSFDYN